MRRRTTTALIVGVAALLVVAADAAEPNLPTLRRKLLEARTDDEVGRALDALQARIGRDGFFADAGAFGDWLDTVPDGRNRHPRVLQRRGWAYARAGRGTEGIAPLQGALDDDPGSGLTRAYLADCLRQAGRYEDAAATAATAAECGYREGFLEVSFLKTAMALRRSVAASRVARLPPYARAIASFLVHHDTPALRATVARWLLDDLARHDRPDSPRGRLWAQTAATHALEAVPVEGPAPDGAAQLVHEAARGLAPQHDDPRWRSRAFDLLVHAVRLGEVRELERHQRPGSLLDLAELAIAERRYALAHRLIEQRLRYGRTPRAIRLSKKLPLDLDAWR